jgi:ABC-type multidrug transport system ATPase subunit
MYPIPSIAVYPFKFNTIVAQPQASNRIFSNQQGITLAFHNLNYVVKDTSKNDKTILSGVSGIVSPGELLAVMGPSGAGKSSFLDSIAGKITSITGNITLNGKEEKVQKVSSDLV